MKKHAGMKMRAVIIGGTVLLIAAAPIIHTEIDMGEFIITGKFAKEEAGNLAAALNSKGGKRC